MEKTLKYMDGDFLCEAKSENPQIKKLTKDLEKIIKQEGDLVNIKDRWNVQAKNEKRRTKKDRALLDLFDSQSKKRGELQQKRWDIENEISKLKKLKVKPEILELAEFLHDEFCDHDDRSCLFLYQREAGHGKDFERYINVAKKTKPSFVRELVASYNKIKKQLKK